MTDTRAVARALAYFSASDDLMLLHRLSAGIAPRARSMVGAIIAKRGEDAIPAPAAVDPAPEPASPEEAQRTLERTDDFALLQTLARAIGRRIEDLETAASAEFGVGARVLVPAHAEFPPHGKRVAGVVTATGTSLRVQLDSGKGWQGPPSLATLERQR